MPTRRWPSPTAAMWSRRGGSQRAAAPASCWPMTACGQPTLEYDVSTGCRSKRRRNDSLAVANRERGEPSRAGGFAIATGGRKGKEVYHARGAARCFGRGQKERCRDMTPRSTAHQGSATGRRKRRLEVPAVTTTESMLD